MSIEVIQEGSKNIPRIHYDYEEEILYISGRSITEKPELVYIPLAGWISDHINRFRQLHVVVFLEYINSGSSKSLRDILKLIGGYKDAGSNVSVTWLYEEDDESMLELGEHYRNAAGLDMDVKMII